ncbi:MAG TPA: LptE family protein [Chitinophagaceae bacterium]|nr:LptE family protein [Chitinophagaceae bacterium]
MNLLKKIFFSSFKYGACLLIIFYSSCNIYKFHDVHFDPDIKTVKINFIENHAQYVNPQLSPKLTDKLRQKIISQTKLSQTNNDNADWEISGYVSSYGFSTSAISNQQVTTNRLSVTVHIILNNHKKDTTQEYDISRSFEFKGDQSIQQAEASLGDEMVRSLTDDIFNKLFSDW